MKWRKIFDMEQEPAGREVVPPVFVTGCMRSGTSYLLAKLCQHPQLLQVGTELNNVWTDIGGATCAGNCAYRDESDLDVRYAKQMSLYFEDYVRKAPRLHRTLMRVRRKLQGDGGRIWYDWDNIIPVNKSPHLMNKIRYVHSLFPESKWIIIVRGVHGHSASMKLFMDKRAETHDLELYYPLEENTSCWFTSFNNNPKPKEEDFVHARKNFWTVPKMWRRLNNLMLADIRELPVDLVKVISYEDLVTNQYDVMMEIFDFLGLQHRKACEKIAGDALKIVNTSSKGNPLEKWKRTLTAEEIETVNNFIKSEFYLELVEELEQVIVSDF